MLLISMSGFTKNQNLLIAFASAAIAALVVAMAVMFINWLKMLRRKEKKYTMQEDLTPKEWEQKMAELARSHVGVKCRRKNYIITWYNQATYRKINMIREQIARTPTEIISLVPSARWLFDNFQMLYREIKKAKVTGTVYLPLPLLRQTEYAGYPRVYVVAKKMIELSRGYLNRETIVRMIEAYQEENPLTEREIHALQEMLGLCLLERTIEVAEEIIRITKIKTRAEAFVRERMRENQDGQPDVSPLLVTVDSGSYRKKFRSRSDSAEIHLAAGSVPFRTRADKTVFFSRADNTMRRTRADRIPFRSHDDMITFHSHVIYLLRRMSVDENEIQKYISYHFEADGRTVSTADIFREEGRRQSELEAQIRTAITSLRELNQIDENELVEELSVTERILARDPAGVYTEMDSTSRAMYRTAVEKLARRTGASEPDVAEACVELAAEERKDVYCSRHVGAYLIGKGYPVLRARLLNRPVRRPGDNRKLKGTLYFMLTAVLFVLVLFLLDYAVRSAGGLETFKRVILALAALPLVKDAVARLARNIMSRIVPAQQMPMMDYLEEIPDNARTVVVMPVIVSGMEQALDYAERLLRHYLVNRQPNLYFALLADYADAPSSRMPEDEEIRSALVSKIEQLNKMYPSANNRFMLLMRERRWSRTEDCYICWERKRGKLEEFNALLNGVDPKETSFDTLICDIELLRTCKYVITLDADSEIERDSAARLIGMIDHPLNRALVDPEKRKVVEGYAIIQPIVRNHIYEKGGGSFAKIFGGVSGLPSYTAAVSDIYQDVFREGIYVGKGIYNVKAFHQHLYKRLPEGRILSHDLLESCYARTAFSSTVSIMENFPGSYMAYAKREHRWIRGDWQLLPWLFKRDLGFLSRWKIADNMIASLIPVSKLLFIILSLLLVPGAYWLCLPVVMFSPVLEIVLILGSTLVHKIRRPRLALVYSLMVREISIMMLRSLLELVFVPAAAFNSLDAILKTLYRLAISKKHLLMWNSAENVERTARNTATGYLFYMGHSGLFAAALTAVLLATSDRGMPTVVVYGLLAAFWAASFCIAYLISHRRDAKPTLKEEDRELLNETARRTWQFFRTYATRENNWLCPDNVQILGRGKTKVTGKTSPTNIGLQFLSLLSARDMGFETFSSMLKFAENMLYTVSVLPKWEGHLYNWYDVNTLEILEPRYVSTVDSGNFIGDMIAFRNGLLEQRDNPVVSGALVHELARLARLNGAELPADLQRVKFGELLKTIEAILEPEDGGRVATAVAEQAAFKEQAVISEKERVAASCGERDGMIRDRDELARLAGLFEEEVQNLGLREYCLEDRITPARLAEQGNTAAAELLDTIAGLCRVIDNLLKSVDFSRLFNKNRMLFHIGYNDSTKTYDNGCYDLIASESMLTSYIAIARGEVPVKHWSKLGRPLTVIRGIPAHVSWSGTMFEYLMPNLLLKEFDGSVFADSARAAVLQQIRYAKNTRYAKGMNIPWGISESQYYMFDMDANYQYKAFGVPMLRLQPVYSDPMVVAPYASVLALEYAGKETLNNLRRIRELNAYGEYGFYEAIDFSAPDPVSTAPYCIVRSFMAHHQGMIMAAINNYLNGGILRRRFHSDPMIRASETLLEEKRHSWFVSVSRKGYTVNIRKKAASGEDMPVPRKIRTVSPPIPVVNYLSNGSYSVLVTSDGDGFSRWGNMMVYRWRPDLYAQTGFYIYIRDVEAGRYWSAAFNPTRKEADHYQAVFSYDRAEFTRKDGDVSTQTTVSLSLEHDLEIRKVTVTNHSSEEKLIELTSYIEVVADTFMAESGHPAFNKLFIESEFIEESDVFISRRRGADGAPVIMHMVRTDRKPYKAVEYENDRMRFIGRLNTLKDPAAVRDGLPLSNRCGFSPDPIMSLRVSILLEPGGKASISFITGVCASREEAVRIGEEMSIPYRIDDIMEKFRNQSETELKYLGIYGNQLNVFQNLIGPVFYPSRYYRGPAERIRRNWKDQSSLWRFGISGDNPILLLTVDSVEEAGFIRKVLKLYEYMRINCVTADLVILSSAKYGYMNELDDMLRQMTSSLKTYNSRDRAGIFILHEYQLVPPEIDLLYTVARVVISKRTGLHFRNVIADVPGWTGRRRANR